MQRIPLIMVNPLTNIPSYPFPEPYSVRHFGERDKSIWAEILASAGEFASIEEGLERFRNEFEPFIGDAEQRIFFIEDGEGRKIGTASAWYGQLGGKSMGRIHWVGITPSHQGKKLAKPLLVFLLKKLSQWHHSSYLKTQTTSLRAINAYLDIGFLPYIQDEADRAGWKLVEKELGRQILN